MYELLVEIEILGAGKPEEIVKLYPSLVLIECSCDTSYNLREIFEYEKKRSIYPRPPKGSWLEFYVDHVYYDLERSSVEFETILAYYVVSPGTHRIVRHRMMDGEFLEHSMVYKVIESKLLEE